MNEIISVFLKLGALGFGGPIATIAMMEEEIVRKRGWISVERFAEIYAICKVLPGPVSTQVAISLARHRGGTLGALVGGMVFILPSFLMVLALSYLYVNMPITHEMAGVFGAMQAAALAIVTVSTVQLARPYQHQATAWLLAGVATALVAWRPGGEPLVIFGAGVLGALIATRAAQGAALAAHKSPEDAEGSSMLQVLVPGLAAGAANGTLAKIFWVCFKAGAFVFGTGLAIIPLLESDTVRQLHWLTHREFMDGLAIGQITPGPVVITVVFIGFKVAGALGALAASAGMFLPAFVNVLFIVPRLWKHVSGRPAAAGFTHWAIPAVIGGIAATSFHLGVQTIQTPLLGAFFLAAFWASFRFKLPAWGVIPFCGLLGGLAQLLGML